MDKMGIIALMVGLVFSVTGSYAIWFFLPEVIIAVKGLIGIVVLLMGIMLAIFGILILND
jgi:hypothetical protein